MAFVHHQPRQQRRDRADDSHHQTHAAPHHRHERQVDQDWSIVFPGRARQAPASPTLDSELTDDSNPLALTLPPLHDGTGRFIASPLSPASTDLASTDAPSNYTNDDGHLSDARHSEDIFPDSVFSGTDSQLDADEELGFGSGSDFDFESDAAASSSHHPGRSPVRRATGAPRTASRRKPSRLSHASHVSIDSDDDDDDGTTPSHSHLLGSKAWSLLARSNALERVEESPSASTQLYSSAHSSRRARRAPHVAHDLPVVLTSGSEREDAEAARAHDNANDDAELAISNLAQSAGLSHLDHADRLRRPKRRHRRSAAGRSSKRSNTSQSLLSVDYDARRFGSRGAEHARSEHAHGADTPKSSTRASHLATAQHASKTSRVIGTILRKVFDLEPEVLDAFLHDDAERQRSSAQPPARTTVPRAGFAFESPDAAPLCAEGMMLDGRSEHERWHASDAETEVGETEADAVDPATSVLFANDKRVRGEEPDDGSGWRLTEAALLQRGSASMRSAGPPSLMEPTTMEALSAFVNTMVMPVPMPLRLLGALFGWSGIWTSSHPANKVDRDEEGARASGEAEEERKYRYERLLSAQQAKAWSQRYRGILFANVDDEQPSPDVPELWRGEEHPAIAAQHVYD